MANINTTWYLETSHPLHLDKTESGGGVCISSNGQVLTNYHVISTAGYHPSSCQIKGRRTEDRGMVREFTLVWAYQRYDLALIEVAKKDDEYEFIDLDNVPIAHLNVLEPVFGHVHQSVVFSTKYGTICYPFPKPINLFNIHDKTTLGTVSEKRREKYKREVLEHPQPYGTLKRYVVDSYEAFSKFHPDLPLIEFSGFGTSVGASGCPIFRSSNSAFLGIIIVGGGGTFGAIPIQFIRHVIAYS